MSWLIVRTIAAVVPLSYCAIPANAQSGEGYAIAKSTIDNGGGTAIGGNYRLSGTVGQLDAGNLVGGDYDLEGGFWQASSAAEPIPTVSEWGMAVLTLLTLTAGTLVLRRNRDWAPRRTSPRWNPRACISQGRLREGLT